jgi:pyrimidine operon attenuation protein/uracil phosphoribosyltransferase
MGHVKTKILGAKEVQNKICRLAFEIYEGNFQEKEIALVGIEPNGAVLAKLLKGEIERISPLVVHFSTIRLDKESSLSKVNISLKVDQVSKTSVILVDDVLNSGRTMFYSFKPFLESELYKVQVAVLVDRAHKKFPISADYVGYSLGTTLQEFVQVNLSNIEEYAVYLL